MELLAALDVRLRAVDNLTEQVLFITEKRLLLTDSELSSDELSQGVDSILPAIFASQQ